MKTALTAFAFLAALPLAAAAQVTKEDIKKLVAAGVSDDVVLTYVRANGPAPRMTADDLIELKQAGAGEKTLASLASGGSNPSTPAPRVEVVEKPVYVPQTTYVYSTPSVSSYWCSSHYSYDGCSSYYARPVVYGSYYYPRYSYYSGYCGPSYYGRHYYSRPRVGISVGWRW